MGTTTSPRIAVFLAHPRIDSYCGALARAYAEGARSYGAEVRTFDLGGMDFELNVTHPSPSSQAMEADLAACQDALAWADHVVFVFPVWWATMPAILKGFLDRVLLPDFAFRIDVRSPTGYRPLLEGRSARLITTMDSPEWVYRWVYGRPGDRAMKGGILGFCGIRPVECTHVCRLKHLSHEEKVRHIDRVRLLGCDASAAWRRLCARRRAFAWIRVVRLQFYAMTFLSYGLGAAAVVKWTPATFSWPVFVFGFLGLFLLELGAVLLNEVHDQGTDRINRNAGPFNGGSRVLLEGILAEASVRRAIRHVLALSVLCFGGVLWLGNAALASMPAAGLLLVTGYLLGPGYTAPPLRFVYRGAGELVVAFTHSPFMVLCGWVFLGGGVDDPRPWLVSLPMFLAIFAAITLAGIPDAEADAVVGKKTLAVAASRRAAGWIAVVSALAAAAVIPLLGNPSNAVRSAFDVILLPLALHAVLLSFLVVRYLGSGAGSRRIDGILFAALTFILWFGAGPLLHLLGSID